MPNYRRPTIPGATAFITLVTHNRQPLFQTEEARVMLRQAIRATQVDHPFTIEEQVLLPDHWHLLLALPSGDADLSTRIAAIKARFTSCWIRAYPTEPVQSQSRKRQAYRAVWQKRFWDHIARDEADMNRIREYIWYNPVKHGLVTCPHAWLFNTFHRAVRRELIDMNWQCTCGGHRALAPPDIRGAEMD